MLPVRVAFDVSLPAVASQAFTAGGRAFKDGDAFDWRALGISEGVLANFWRSGLVHFDAASRPPTTDVAPRAPQPPPKHHRR